MTIKINWGSFKTLSIVQPAALAIWVIQFKEVITLIIRMSISIILNSCFKWHRKLVSHYNNKIQVYIIVALIILHVHCIKCWLKSTFINTCNLFGFEQKLSQLFVILYFDTWFNLIKKKCRVWQLSRKIEKITTEIHEAKQQNQKEVIQYRRHSIHLQGTLNIDIYLEMTLITFVPGV